MILQQLVEDMSRGVIYKNDNSDWLHSGVISIVMKSCAGHNSITLWDIIMILDQIVEDIK